MVDPVVALPTWEELSGYVHRTLCETDALDPAQAPLRTTTLTRLGRPCGLIFHVEGPRLLRTSAVWSADDHRLLFYDSTGSRMRSLNLSESPEMPTARAA